MNPVTRLGDVFPATPEEFVNCEVVFQASWASYEESGAVVVFKFFDEYFVQEWGYCVFAENNDPYFDPYPIYEFELPKLKAQWAEVEDFYPY